MKILTISSYYPPYHYGGYELRCKHVMDGFFLHGHEILVLTSQVAAAERLERKEQACEYPIYRSLHIRRNGNLIDQMTLHRWSYPFGILMIFLRELWFALHDTAFVEKWIKKFQPDVIYLGQIMPFSKTLIPYLAQFNIPVILDDGGATLITMVAEKGVWFKYAVEVASQYSVLNSVKSVAVNFISVVCGRRLKTRWAWPKKIKVIFNNEFSFHAALKNPTAPMKDAQIIHSGINTDLFKFRSKQVLSLPISIIAPGRVDDCKGQIDAVRLLAKLLGSGLDAQLVIVGKVWHKSYRDQIANEINALGLTKHVTSLPMVSHDELVMLYQESDICFFPSYQEPGFSRTPLEAMACGSIVITYGNEGSREYVRHGENGFLVSPEDYVTILSIIQELCANPEMVRKITDEARKEVDTMYSMRQYIEQLDALMLSWA